LRTPCLFVGVLDVVGAVIGMLLATRVLGWTLVRTDDPA
jgi:hypothetical protein